MGTDTLFKSVRHFVAVLRKQERTLEMDRMGVSSPVLATVLSWLSDTWNFCLFLCALPLVYLMAEVALGALGPNPVESFHLFTGIWGLRFLCITLLITPLQAVTAWRGVAAYRQLFGLAAFFYAGLHVYGYLSIDHAWVWRVIGRDILETPYIWPGLLAAVILTLLALSSPKQGKKLLGKNWKKLHRWIYVAAVVSILHYIMQLKGNLADPLFYGLIIGLLFVARILIWIRNRQVARLMIPRPKRTADGEVELPTSDHSYSSTGEVGPIK